MQFGQGCRKFTARDFHRELVTADFADLRRGHAHELRAFDDFHGIQPFATDDNARLSFAEEQSVQSRRTGVAPVSI